MKDGDLDGTRERDGRERDRMSIRYEGGVLLRYSWWRPVVLLFHSGR